MRIAICGVGIDWFILNECTAWIQSVEIPPALPLPEIEFLTWPPMAVSYQSPALRQITWASALRQFYRRWSTYQIHEIKLEQATVVLKSK